jgi:hypothetical protein
MFECTLKLEFLKPEHLGDHGIDIKYVDNYQNDEQNWKDNIESFTKNRNNICLSHHLRERCFSIVDNLKEIIAKRC